MKRRKWMAEVTRFVAVICTVLLFAGALAGKAKSGDKLLAEGRVAEERHDYDQALELYEKALSQNPSNPAFLIAVRRARFQSAQTHVDAGRKLRTAGELQKALAEFQKACVIDTSSTIAQQELSRTYLMIQKQTGATRTSDRLQGATPAEAARLDLQSRLSSIQGPAQLTPLVTKIAMLQMTNQPAFVLYETVGKLAGVNVVVDSDVKTQSQGKYSVDFNNQTLGQALDYIAVITKTFWKPLSTNAIFVTLESPNKRRDYEDQSVKVFYLQNTTTPQEVTEISMVLRTIVDMKRVFIYAVQNAIIIRGTADQVALAEKLVYDLDKPKPEVVVDVVVMEASKTRSHDIAAGLTSSGGIGLSVPITPTFTTTSTSTTDSSGSTTIAKLGHLASSDFSLTLPGAQFSLIAGDSKTRILQSPQVRASDNQKATLKVGERIPIATGSYSAGATAASVNPLVSTQFNYQDVGVNVDITPHIHGADEVSIHVEIEISNVDGYSNLGGLSQPIIGQRKIIHDVRMREGEVNLLGGLQHQQSSRTNSGLPGLLKVPLLRAIFGEDKQDSSDTEILIALIPHIVRTSNLDEINMKSVAVGNDTNIQIRKATERQPQAAEPR